MIDIDESETVDLGQPGRKLLDGCYTGTILTSEEHFGKQSGALMVHVDVSVPYHEKNAPEGAVLLSTYLPCERTPKIKDLSKIGGYAKALGVTLKGFDARLHVGKPIRVVVKWVPSRDPKYEDRAEIMGFLAPLPGQKPITIPGPKEAAAEGGDGSSSADPFSGEA